MLKAMFGKVMHLGLSPAGISLVQSKPMWRPATGRQTVVHQFDEHTEPDDFPRMASEVRSLLSQAHCRGSSLRITLADQFARYFIVTPARNTTSVQDCEDMARLRFQSLYGEQDADWIVQADWHPSLPFVACAVPRLLVNRLNEIASEFHITILGIVPQFIREWNRWQNRMLTGDWLAVSHEGWLCLGCRDVTGAPDVRGLPVSKIEAARPNWLNDTVHQLALQLNVPVPKRLIVSGSVHSQWAGALSPPLTLVQMDEAHPGNDGNNSPLLDLAFMKVEK